MNKKFHISRRRFFSLICAAAVDSIYSENQSPLAADLINNLETKCIQEMSTTKEPKVPARIYRTAIGKALNYDRVIIRKQIEKLLDELGGITDVVELGGITDVVGRSRYRGGKKPQIRV